MNTKFQDPIITSTSGLESLDEQNRYLIFDDGGDELILQVSVISDESTFDEELIEGLVDVMRAYGFSDLVESVQAPGSWFAKLKGKFHSDDKAAAKRSKAELQKDLRSEKPPHSAPKAKAVGRLKNALKKLKKGSTTIIAIVGSFVGHAAYDAGKGAVSDWMKGEIPKIEHVIKDDASKLEQKVRGYFVVDAKPDDAQLFHQAVDRKVEGSPKKSAIPIPPASK